MESIAQKIEKIYESKIAIKASLAKKGIQVDSDFSTYASAIDSINVGASVFTSEEELNANENKQEGNLAIVYNDLNPTTPVVFKVIDLNVDLFYIDGNLWSIPCLSNVIKECDTENYGQYYISISSSDTSKEPYTALNYRFIALLNDKTWFYREASNNYLRIANSNKHEVEIKFADYSLNGNVMGRVSTLPLAAGTEESPSYYDAGPYATYNNQKIGNYNNSVCYSDILKTGIVYNSSTLEKGESDLQYTQLS